jgi:acyl-CoA-binding protein
LASIATLLLAGVAPAQGVLDLLDGETLYQGGFLLTLGAEYERREVLRQGTDRVADPFASHEFETRTTLALQYGLHNTVQIGIALPYVTHDLQASSGDMSVAGIGDVELIGKWRFYRWDAPGKAFNVALISELSLPTGRDDAQRAGVRLPPDQQAGSGSVDPSLGIGATQEPGRWRFNAAMLYRWRTDADGDHSHLGDDFVSEIAAGNRFWLEPYPGPFMRLDLLGRYYWQAHDRLQGASLPDSGGERATVGLNWAFRPRPSLDFQIQFERSVWQDVNGVQLGHDWILTWTNGWRF